MTLFEQLRSGQVPEADVLLSTARERYFSEHKRGADIRFTRDVNRGIDFVIATIGDFPLQNYTRDHARQIRDALGQGHATSTVRRQLDSINAVINFGRREFNLQCLNPFERMNIPNEGLDVEKRDPFTFLELQSISSACRKLDDDIRHIVAIQLATGARLGEIVGLRRADVSLDFPVPYIHIRPHLALGRSLKTPGSERRVPLIGVGFWAACQAIKASNSSWLFPRYSEDGSIRATHASNTINKWLRETLHIPKTSHSFRHSMKDLLRNSSCPEAIAKQLLGHGSLSVADSYGHGYSLPILKDHLQKAYELVFPNLDIPSADSWQGFFPPDSKGRLLP